MEDESCTEQMKSINNGETPEDTESTSVSAELQNQHEDDLEITSTDDIVKSEVPENETEGHNVEEVQHRDQNESSLVKTEDPIGTDNNEESGALSSVGDTSLTSKELNGEVEVLENSVNETLQVKVEQQESQQESEEDSRCDIVRRSIRNRKPIDNRQSDIVKHTKASKESSIKKSKKPLPMIASNSEQNKRIEGSRVGIGSFRARKKVQRKREKISVGNLRGSMSNRVDPSPRPAAMAAPLTCAEYAQCLGLQPAVKFKCHKCGETNFGSIGMLREHQAGCPGVVGAASEEAAACATLATSGSNLHITQKLILCSACDTYFESWDLFLHMQSVHRRHICLFCLAMFSRAERLAGHLGSAHGASEASHPSADAFRSSRQSPCLLVCCTCERIFSDGDEFFDHSCRGGGLAGSSGENMGISPSGGSGDGRREPSGGGKCSDGTNLNTDCSSGTTGSDHLKNTHTNQGTTESDGDCTVNNAANLCQLHIRMAAKKSLKRKDNVLIVIFEKGDQNSDQMLMRVESKATLEANTDNEDHLTEEASASAEKNLSDESMSQEGDSKHSSIDLDASHKDGMDDKIFPQKSVDSEINETVEPREENEIKTPEIENGPRSDMDESSSDEVHKIEAESKDLKSPESNIEPIAQSSASKQADSDAQSEGELEERDVSVDHSLSEMSNDSRDEINEKKLPANDSCDADICEDSVISKSRDSPIKFDSDSQSCSDNINKNVNGGDEVCESPKSLKDGDKPIENSLKSEEIDVNKTIQSDDEPIAAENNDNDEESTKQENEIINQQNGFDRSPNLASESLTAIDGLDESGIIQLAGEEVPLTNLHLEKCLKDYSIQDLLKEAVKVSCFSCVYCTHAKKIAVNGKQLALHLLAEHRFQPIFSPPVKSYENDRESEDSDYGHICVEKVDNQPLCEDYSNKKESVDPLDHKAITEFVKFLKDSIEQLESSCFNCDSYDNSNASASKVFSKSYECFQCRFATGLHKELYIHNRKMHQKTNLLCIMCKCTFYSYSELLCHLCPGMYVPHERPHFRCCFCSADSLPSAFRFMVHLRKRHHACDVCLEVTGDQQRLSGHVWKHKLNHLCYRCDIAYRNKPDITKHLFWKHGTESVLCKRCLQKKWPHVYHFCVPPAVFTCEECGSTFSRAVALRVHRRLHVGEAPHACPECGQHFISKRLVTRHQEIKHGDSVPKKVADVLSDSDNVAVDSKIQPDGSSLDQIDPNNCKIKNEFKNSVISQHFQEQPSENKVDSVGNINEGSYPSRSNETSLCSKTMNNEIQVDTKEKDVDVENGQQSVEAEKDLKPQKKVVDVMDLPPLNLSSESDDSDDEVPPSKTEALENDNNETKIHSDEEKQDQGNCSPQLQEDDAKPVEVVDGIWDNFKTYAATLEDPKSQLGETSEMSKGALLSEDIGLMARIIKAEHDYCFPRENIGDSTENAMEESEVIVKEAEEGKDKEDGSDHNYCSNNSKEDGSEVVHSSEVQEVSPKKHPKSPKKRKKTGSGTSSSEASDSSDSDSSSCSCGTNCSCSSSSSSSASSSSASDSDSSVTSGRGAARASRREKRKEGKRKRHLGSSTRTEEKVCSTGDSGVRSPCSVKDGNSRVDAVIAEEEAPPLREVMIRESDLETEESETDEDFYDEQPRRFHGNSAAVMVLARLATGNSPSTVPLDDSTLPSPATSVQSPASRPASPTTSLQHLQPSWKPPPPAPLTPIPPPIPPPPVPVVPEVVQPEVRNSLQNISEGCTPLIQPKKRGRKRKRPHLPIKLPKRNTENEKCSSDLVPNLCLKVSKSVRRHKVATPQQSYKNSPPVEVHSVHNSAGAVLNSSIMHGVSEPTTPTSIMEGDDGIRLSKRKRVPKRFYGDSSDEEAESGGGNSIGGGSVSGGGGSSKFTIVLNQTGKIPKRKKSSIGPGSSVSFSRESTNRSSLDEVHLQRPVYQPQEDVDDQEISDVETSPRNGEDNAADIESITIHIKLLPKPMSEDMSSDRDEEESQNGRSEGDSEGWSGDEGRNEEGSSCTLPSVSSPRTANQIPGESVGANTGSLYCYCQCPYDEVSEMIACDGKKCAIEWFHFECVGIMVPPKGKWYCPDCRKRCGSSGRTSDHLSGT